jgi:hypothetical protein
MVPLPLPAVAYLCGPAVHFVLCFFCNLKVHLIVLVAQDGVFCCAMLLLSSAMRALLPAVVVQSTAACCFCPLFLSLLLFGERGELAVNYFGNKLLPPPSTVWGWGLQGWWCLWGRGGSKLLR